MRTKEQLTVLLANKYFQKLLTEAKWSDLKLAVSNDTIAQKLQLMTLLINGKSAQAGKLMRRILVQDVKVQAQAKADTAMADSALDLVEIDELL